MTPWHMSLWRHLQCQNDVGWGDEDDDDDIDELWIASQLLQALGTDLRGGRVNVQHIKLCTPTFSQTQEPSSWSPDESFSVEIVPKKGSYGLVNVMNGRWLQGKVDSSNLPLGGRPSWREFQTVQFLFRFMRVPGGKISCTKVTWCPQ